MRSLLLLLAVASAAPAFAQRGVERAEGAAADGPRVALVIGNAGYGLSLGRYVPAAKVKLRALERATTGSAVFPSAPRPLVAQVPAAQKTEPKSETADFKAGQTFKDCADCPEMVVVPAGSFVMGSPAKASTKSPKGSSRCSCAKPAATWKVAGKKSYTLRAINTRWYV